MPFRRFLRRFVAFLMFLAYISCLLFVAFVSNLSIIHRNINKQASAVVGTGIASSEVVKAAKSALASSHWARQPEVFLEVRACVDRDLPWCSKVSTARNKFVNLRRKARALHRENAAILAC